MNTIRRDSKAWSMQVWISFLISVFLCAVGLAFLPGTDLDRAFMVMGYFFCLLTVFVLSKSIRDEEKSDQDGRNADLPMFKVMVWGGFLLAMALTAWGLWRMDISQSYKAFLGVSWLYLITCSFTLAKTLRDRHEADLLEGVPVRRRQAAE